MEDSDGAVQCWMETAKKLAQGLEVDLRVLTGDVPMPDELGQAPPSTRINGDLLRRLREMRGLSQKQLAEESLMSPAQIRRIEKEKCGRGSAFHAGQAGQGASCRTGSSDRGRAI